MLPRRLPLLVAVLQAGHKTGPVPIGDLCCRLFDFSDRASGWLRAEDSSQPDFLDAPPPMSCTDAYAVRSYHDFHQKISALCAPPAIRAGLDCRIRPAAAGPAGKWLFCLSNGGDVVGEPIPGQAGVTCPPDWLRDFRDLAVARLADLGADVRLNDPPGGSYLIRHYARPGLPWIRLDLAAAGFLTADGGYDQKRIRQVRSGLETVLALWCRIEAW